MIIEQRARANQADVRAELRLDDIDRGTGHEHGMFIDQALRGFEQQRTHLHHTAAEDNAFWIEDMDDVD